MSIGSPQISISFPIIALLSKVSEIICSICYSKYITRIRLCPYGNLIPTHEYFVKAICVTYKSSLRSSPPVLRPVRACYTFLLECLAFGSRLSLFLCQEKRDGLRNVPFLFRRGSGNGVGYMKRSAALCGRFSCYGLLIRYDTAGSTLGLRAKESSTLWTLFI